MSPQVICVWEKTNRYKIKKTQHSHFSLKSQYLRVGNSCVGQMVIPVLICKQFPFSQKRCKWLFFVLAATTAAILGRKTTSFSRSLYSHHHIYLLLLSDRSYFCVKTASFQLSHHSHHIIITFGTFAAK